MPFSELRKTLAQQIEAVLKNPNLKAASLMQEFTTPPNVELGHVALPCFKLSKTLKRQSHEIAKELATQMAGPDLQVRATGPYVNFKWNTNTLYTATLGQIFSQKENYGSDQLGAGKQVVIEYCSPNIAKRLAFHHIRSTLLGATLSNIYKFMGFGVERVNWVGDWGAQFAKLLAAVELWGNPEALSEDQVQESMEQLFRLYVRFNKEQEKEDSYLAVASKALKRLEQKEPKATELWQRIRNISIISMQRTLDRLPVGFDHVDGESQYIPEINKMFEEVKTRAGAELSEGAWIVKVDGVKTPALIQKSDGTTLYITRDIATAIDRHERFGFEQMLYVVAQQQSLHFQLLFGVLKKMGYEWADRCEHVSFGTVLFGTEKMSTREGNVVFLDDLLDQAKELALRECTAKNPDLPNKEDVAEKVGIGAVIFGELSTNRQRDFDFKWETILALDGETGPYVQYSLVRCFSLLRKAQESGQVNVDELKVVSLSADRFASEEDVLIVTLAKFRSVLHQVVAENEPAYLARYLVEVAKVFNRFYYQLPVLQESERDQREMRVQLVMATKQVLSNGLSLLGIEWPDEM